MALRSIVTAAFLWMLSTLQVNGQVDYERTHWVFGRNAKLSFDANGITATGTAPLNAYTGSACYTNKDGDLILYTNGNAVYGESENLLGTLETLSPDQGSFDAVILPANEEETKFNIVAINTQNEVKHAFVDLEANNGTGLLAVNFLPIVGNVTANLTAVKHCFLDAYWVICSGRSDLFYSILVKSDGFEEPVVSKIGTSRITVGDFVTNHAGDQLAISEFNDNWVEVFDFDKRCGTISNTRRLALPDAGNPDHPHGMTFAPNDRSLYVAYSYQQSSLVQYDMDDLSVYFNCYSSTQNINDVAIAIDGQLYMNVHQDNIPSRRIHQLQNPNAKTGGHPIVEDVATLVTGTNGAFEFPNFVANKTGGTCEGLPSPGNRSILVNNNRCIDKEVFFDASWTTDACDSIRWNFDDPGKPDNNTNDPQIRRYFDTERIYNVECYLFYCGEVDTVHFTIDMKAPPSINLGNDTTLCAGQLLGIGIELNYDSMRWRDGANPGPFRLVPPGTYALTVYNGQCAATDEITVDVYPDIWTELEAEYRICDLEQETVKLDAGAGFVSYKWTPTGDTTQWIIVQEIGEYIVIVDAFTGCTGDGRTIVKRTCDLDVFIPNSFSPNNDGLNDVFQIKAEFVEDQEMRIYNRWGEEIYHENDINAAWDGSAMPPGVYLYQIEVKGFQNKRPITLRKAGTVHLVR
ncbi:MAG: gliding motility-associated C-terminal domain-containing protein [Bacteroidia bacterium]|nr:gliding motility-associated C-terminal domain-containing protein [Bacteroidia bacterium]